MKTTYQIAVTLETQFEPTVREHVAASIRIDRALNAIPGVIEVVITDFDQLEEKGPAESPKRWWTFTVNGLEITTDETHLTYDLAVRLAEEDILRNLSITYRDRSNHASGIIHRNGPFPLITDGMVVNVADTGNA